MNKISTSIRQSKKLIELGIDINTADMDYIPFANDPENYDCVINLWNNEHEDDWIPAWSLSALLSLLKPCGSETYTMQGTLNGGATVEFHHITNLIIQEDSPLDAVFKMVIWLKEIGKI